MCLPLSPSAHPALLQPGESVQDPLDNCLTVTCDLAKDGNVTRREKETTCDTECALGQTFIEPIEGR